MHFEPNDANAWVLVRDLVSNFLFQQWKIGALQGIKPEHAYFVKVGLGETMTAQDILGGKMIVEIGMAVIRPAEFIIIRISIKMTREHERILARNHSDAGDWVIASKSNCISFNFR